MYLGMSQCSSISVATRLSVEGKVLQETYLSFGLATALFIFNLFAEALQWIIVSSLRWVLYHYFDNFMTIFKANTSPERLKAKVNTYIRLTDFLGFP